MTKDGLQIIPYNGVNQNIFPITPDIAAIYNEDVIDGAIVSLDAYNNPIYASNPLPYGPVLIEPRPIFKTKSYDYTINNDPNLQKTVTGYFFRKLSDSWMHELFADLQRYLDVDSSGEIKFVKNIDEFKKIDNKHADQKIKFIIEEVFTKHDMHRFLAKYVETKNVKWYDLKTQHKSDVKKNLHKKLKNHMRKLVLSKL